MIWFGVLALAALVWFAAWRALIDPALLPGYTIKREGEGGQWDKLALYAPEGHVVSQHYLLIYSFKGALRMLKREAIRRERHKGLLP